MDPDPPPRQPSGSEPPADRQPRPGPLDAPFALDETDNCADTPARPLERDPGSTGSRPHSVEWADGDWLD